MRDSNGLDSRTSSRFSDSATRCSSLKTGTSTEREVIGARILRAGTRLGAKFEIVELSQPHPEKGAGPEPHLCPSGAQAQIGRGQPHERGRLVRAGVEGSRRRAISDPVVEGEHAECLQTPTQFQAETDAELVQQLQSFRMEVLVHAAAREIDVHPDDVPWEVHTESRCRIPTK